MDTPAEFKSPLDEEMNRHGHRYGILVYFVKSALEHAQIKHMPKASPYLHNEGFDESCIRCQLGEAIKHAEQPGWEGLEWKGGKRS